MAGRRHKRHYVHLPATAFQDGYAIKAMVTNVSAGGALLSMDSISAAALYNGPLQLQVKGLSRLPCVVRWRAAYRCGLSFEIPERMRTVVEGRLRRLHATIGSEGRAQGIPEPGPPQPEDQPTTDLPPVMMPRRHQRQAAAIRGQILQEGVELPCQITDLSPGGARVTFDGLSIQAIRDTGLKVVIPGFGTYPAEFRWRSGSAAGLEFRITRMQAHAIEQQLTAGTHIRRPTRDG